MRYQVFQEDLEGQGCGHIAESDTLQGVYDFLCKGFLFDVTTVDQQFDTYRVWWVKDLENQTLAAGFDTFQLWECGCGTLSDFRFWIGERMCLPEEALV